MFPVSAAPGDGDGDTQPSVLSLWLCNGATGGGGGGLGVHALCWAATCVPHLSAHIGTSKVAVPEVLHLWDGAEQPHRARSQPSLWVGSGRPRAVPAPVGS